MSQQRITTRAHRIGDRRRAQEVARILKRDGYEATAQGTVVVTDADDIDIHLATIHARMLQSAERSRTSAPRVVALWLLMWAPSVILGCAAQAYHRTTTPARCGVEAPRYLDDDSGDLGYVCSSRED